MANIDLNRLEIFKEVALAGSFSKAALKLKQPKSRISRQVAGLEKELGLQLIFRTTRQFQMTEAGRDLFHKSLGPLSELKSAITEAGGRPGEIKGLIRMTVPEDLGVQVMGPLCFQFMREHPQVQIELNVANASMDLVKESIDLAVRIGPARDSSLMQKKLGSIGLVFVCSPELRQNQPPVNRLEDLEKLPFLAFSPLESRRPSIRVSNGKEVRTLRFQKLFSTNNFFVLKELALEGAGLIVIPEFLVRDEIREGRLVFMKPDWRTEENPVRLLYPQQKELPLRTRRLIEFLSDRLAPYLVG